MTAYYNDNNPAICAWLRELMADGQIPEGEVDERSIVDVAPADLRGFSHCHFFAGVGGWPYALKLAGWKGSVWTGSCPCQPLSSAGQRKGHADERHLWPAFQRLIAERRPATIFGEQVASNDGREWLAGVRADLEHLGYAVGCADLPAACVGAPHIRQRLFWMADADGARWESGQFTATALGYGHPVVAAGGAGGGLADAGAGRCRPGQRHLREPRGQSDPDGRGALERLGDSGGAGLEERAGEREDAGRQRPPAERTGDAGGVGDAEYHRREGRQSLWRGADAALPSSAGFWSGGAWLPCADGKARRVEPGIFPLAPGFPRGMVPSGDPGAAEVEATGEARGVRLRGYGNAIVPQVAAAFIRASIKAVP